MFGFLPLTPMVDDFALQRLLDAPWQAFGWTTVLFLTSILTCTLGSAGYKWCPAALSVTSSTAARMFWGYLAQVLMLGSLPTSLTIGGALLMFVGVVVMAGVRGPAQPPVRSRDQDLSGFPGPEEVDGDEVPQSDAAEVAEEKESLAAFIATEFAERMPHSPTKISPGLGLEEGPPVRQRSRAVTSDAVTLGAVALGVVPTDC